MSPSPENLELDDQAKNAFDALVQAHRILGRGVVFTGPPGTGKSTLLAEFARPFVSQALPAISRRTRHPWLDRAAIWASAAEFVQDVKTEIDLAKRSDFTDFSDAFSASGIARRVAMLFLDDLGAEVNTEYARDVVESLIDARYRDRESLKTFFTTNLSIPELVRRYSDRTVSRLCEMCEIFQFAGADRRMARYL